MIKAYIILSFLFQSCQPTIEGAESAGIANVKFYTNYSYVAGAKVFIDGIEFTKLVFSESEPYCDNDSFRTFKAARGRYYKINYTDIDAATEIDTAIMIPAYNNQECNYINLNN